MLFSHWHSFFLWLFFSSRPPSLFLSLFLFLSLSLSLSLLFLSSITKTQLETEPITIDYSRSIIRILHRELDTIRHKIDGRKNRISRFFLSSLFDRFSQIRDFRGSILKSINEILTIWDSNIKYIIAMRVPRVWWYNIIVLSIYALYSDIIL